MIGRLRARRRANVTKSAGVQRRGPVAGAANFRAVAAAGNRLSVNLTYVRGRELGPGAVELGGARCEIPGALVDADGYVYLAIDAAAGIAELVLDPVRANWEREQWGRREPVLIAVSSRGSLALHGVVRVDDEVDSDGPGHGGATLPVARRLSDVLARRV